VWAEEAEDYLAELRAEDGQMVAGKSKTKAIGKARPYQVPLILACIFALSMVCRSAFVYPWIFPAEGIVIFQGNDPWMHMRLAENMAHNWPWPMFYDYYTWFPHGSFMIIAPVMSWLIAGIGYIVSFGFPTLHTLEVVGAWLPPVIGSLCVIPIYFIGREMHDKWTGILAAALLAILPSGFMNRSLLGFTDHHVLEVLLALFTMMFLMFGYKRQQTRYYLLAGVSLGLFKLSWHGAIFFLFIIWVWGVVQYLVDHWHNEDRGWHNTFWVFLIAATFYLPWNYHTALPPIYAIASVGATATFPALAFITHRIESKKRLRLTLIGLSVAILAGTYVFSPSTLGLFEYAFAVDLIRTIAETMPLSPQMAFHAYGLNLVLMIGGLFVAMKRRQRPLVLTVFSLIIFIAVSTQVRWDYYFVVVISLFSAYFFTTMGVYFIKEVRRGVSLVLCVALLFLTLPVSLDVMRSGPLMTQDWYVALKVLGDNSPEPFAAPDAYYELNLEEAPQYGVLSWWDYGHWITYVSRRVPVANPFQQGAVEAAAFFVDGVEVPGVSYVIVDEAMLTTKYYAMVSFLGRSPYGITKAPEDAAISKLMRGELPGYRMIFAQNTVWIFEKESTG